MVTGAFDPVDIGGALVGRADGAPDHCVSLRVE